MSVDTRMQYYTLRAIGLAYYAAWQHRSIGWLAVVSDPFDYICDDGKERYIHELWRTCKCLMPNMMELLT